MKKYDFRIDSDRVKNLKNKMFNKYKHAEFEYTNTVTLYVGLMIDDVSYEICNDYEQLDYFGWDNEATVCRIKQKPWELILNNSTSEIVETNINDVIKEIIIVNDHYLSFNNGIQNYDLWETRAVIFDFGDYQLSFEKQDCWFSMEIEINKGENLIEKISDGKFILKDFEQSEKQTIKTERKIIKI